MYIYCVKTILESPTIFMLSDLMLLSAGEAYITFILIALTQVYQT
jgi:hypothetical protein